MGQAMHEQAFAAQCAGVSRHAKADERGGRHLTLLALTLGSFCIGTSEFMSMGVLQLFASDLHLSLPQATSVITAYAIGVLLGAPLITLLAARLNRRTLLLLLAALFVIGNALSAIAPNAPALTAARFVAGLPHGGYFGAGAVVAGYIVGPHQSGRAFAIVMTGLTVATIVGSPIATYLGQNLGWRDAYLAVAGLSVLSLLALWLWIPRTDALGGAPVTRELSALAQLPVLLMMIVAAIGVGSIFAVYTFIGPFITEVNRADGDLIPWALALFGIGMTAGNIVGGRLADARPILGVAGGFGAALVVLIALALGGGDLVVLMACLFGVGACMMVAIPAIQVTLTRLAPDAPTLMGAMNLAALNIANAIGAWAGGFSISLGYGLLSPAWAGFACTLAGLLLFGLSARLLGASKTDHGPAPAETAHKR